MAKPTYPLPTPTHPPQPGSHSSVHTLDRSLSNYLWGGDSELLCAGHQAIPNSLQLLKWVILLLDAVPLPEPLCPPGTPSPPTSPSPGHHNWINSTLSVKIEKRTKTKRFGLVCQVKHIWWALWEHPSSFRWYVIYTLHNAPIFSV